jgi:hypothetical protein
MLALSLMLAGIQIGGTNVPESFRTEEMRVYLGCVRSEEDASPDPEAPRLVQFTQVMWACRERRAKWGNVLRGLIQARHAEWTHEQVVRAAEFVITGFELSMVLDWQNQRDEVTHQAPEPQF